MDFTSIVASLFNTRVIPGVHLPETRPRQFSDIYLRRLGCFVLPEELTAYMEVKEPIKQGWQATSDGKIYRDWR